MNKTPFLYYVIFFSLGVFCATPISISIKINLLLLIFSFLTLILTHIFKYFKTFSVLILIFWFLSGICLTKVHNYIPQKHYTNFIEKGNKQFITVKIKDKKSSNKTDKKYIADVQTISYKGYNRKVTGEVLLLLNKEEFQYALSLGNEYELKVRINEVEPPRNPHQFNYKKYLARNYIYNIVVVEEILSKTQHTSVLYTIKNFNKELADRIDSSILKLDSKEFLKAFLLGDRTEMKKENIQAYSKAGIMHLIAISGMHIAFIFGIVFYTFHLFFGKSRQLIVLLSLVFIWFFGIFVGFESSVFRSCLMITIYYAFELLKRHSNIFHSMSLSALIILLINPNEIYNIGFQLSYAAVFFIIWLSPAFEKIMETRKKKINTILIKPLALTFSAQLGTLPLVLFYFNQFSLLSIIINILLIPYTYLITYTSLLEIALIFTSESIQNLFHPVYDFIIGILIAVTHRISSVEILSLKNISLNNVELLALLMFCVFLKKFLCTRKLNQTILLLLCICCFQVGRVLQQDSKGKQIIVFNNHKPLIGIREGCNLIIFKDELLDEQIIKDYIITPYQIGERIKQVTFKDINYQTEYQWNGYRIIPVLRNYSYEIKIITDERVKNVMYGHGGEIFSEDSWKLKEQGAFVKIL